MLARTRAKLHDDLKGFVEFEGHDPLLAAERYYERSEQRPAKFFQVAEEDFVMIGAHPDYDEDWFDQLTLDQVQSMQEDENVNLLETRALRWVCGCGRQKILEVIAPVAAQDMDALFQGDPEITVNCPRCAAKYQISREEAEAAAAADPPPPPMDSAARPTELSPMTWMRLGAATPAAV